MAKIASWAELKDQEELRLSLEGIVKPHNEGVLRVREHITLGLGIPNKVVSLDLVLGKYFHGVELASLDLSDEVDLAEGALAEALERHEVFRADAQLALLGLLLARVVTAILVVDLKRLGSHVAMN